MSVDAREVGQERWTLREELLAQLIEEVSIVATETWRRKEPREVWRPSHLKEKNQTKQTTQQGIKHAVSVLAATTPGRSVGSGVRPALPPGR